MGISFKDHGPEANVPDCLGQNGPASPFLNRRLSLRIKEVMSNRAQENGIKSMTTRAVEKKHKRNRE